MGNNCLHRKTHAQYKYSKEDLILYLDNMQLRNKQRLEINADKMQKQKRIADLLEQANKLTPHQKRISQNQSVNLDNIDETENESSYIEIQTKKDNKTDDDYIVEQLIHQQEESEEIIENEIENEENKNEQLFITKKGLRDENDIDDDILLYFNTNMKQYSSQQHSQMGL